MAQKIPPPPTLSREYQQLNRWLLEIQSILNDGGGINPDQIPGLPALFLQVTANTASIAANTANIAANTAAIAANTAAIATNTANITAANINIGLLAARNQVRNGVGVPGGGLGNNGDLYINNNGPAVGGPDNNLYAKIGGAWFVFA